MKYYKFEKIKKGDNPIIRITYKTWWGKSVIKDVVKSFSISSFWVFMENGDLTHDFQPINVFNDYDYDVYWVNGED